jgi:viologen exporter family transport system permease protein
MSPAFGALRLYWELAVIGFQRAAAYRSAAISGAITNTFFGFLRAYVFIALYQARLDAGGYSLQDALTFTFLTQGMAALIEMWGWWRIADTVQTGQVATDLSRPFDYEFYWLAQDYGRALFQFFLRSVPPFIVGMIAFDVALPPDPALWLAIVPSLILAVTVSFAWRFCLNLTSFWLLDYRGVAGISNLVAILLSGFTVPVAMFPDAMRGIIYLLPFASMVAIPIDIFLGKYTGPELAAVLALQSFWAFAALAAGRLVLAAALHKLVVQGG